MIKPQTVGTGTRSHSKRDEAALHAGRLSRRLADAAAEAESAICQVVETDAQTPQSVALSRFADAFGAFLETIQESGRYGPTAELSAKYDVLREELSNDYPALQPALAARVDPLEEHRALSFDFHGLWSDPFETLLATESLGEALDRPSRITAREALRAVKAIEKLWEASEGLSQD